MYCSNCGTELVSNSNFCNKCGTKIGKDVNNNDSEIIIMKGLCNRVKSILYVQNGNAILTNKRFIYLKHSLAKTMAIGVFVNLTEGSYDFDIPLSNISNIEDGRQGISKTIIINTKDGERYNFYFTNREEWKIKIQSALTSFALSSGTEEQKNNKHIHEIIFEEEYKRLYDLYLTQTDEELLAITNSNNEYTPIAMKAAQDILDYNRLDYNELLKQYNSLCTKEKL